MSAPEGGDGLVAARHVDGVITKAKPVIPAIAHNGLLATPTKEQALKLQELAYSIRKREDALAACAQAIWLANGLALLEAKKLLLHGQFEKWCEQELTYKKSTAEKLMRAARVLGPAFESVSVTLLPPPTLAYTLSAPSVSQATRDAVIPRMVAGEIGQDEVLAALKQHRSEVRQAKERNASLLAESAQAQKAQEKCGTIGAHNLMPEVTEPRAEQENRVSAQSAALHLIVARLGDDLPELLALVAQADGKIFGAYAESELQARVREMSACPVGAEAVVGMDDPKNSDAETFTAPSGGCSQTPAESAPVSNLLAGNAAVPILAEPLIADVPPPATSETPVKNIGKFGDLGSLVRTFPTARCKE